MNMKIKWKKNDLIESEEKAKLDFLNSEEIHKARKFHERFPRYTKTPLVSLEALSKKSYTDPEKYRKIVWDGEYPSFE